MSIRSNFLVLLAATAIVGSAQSASAEVGEAVAVIPKATATGQAGARALVVGAPVFMGDQLLIGPAGETQLHFVDDTRLVIGPSSSITIDKFIVDDRRVTDLSVKAGVGSFRFITGSSEHKAYSIRTPNAVIVVHGTSVDFTVSEESTGVVVYSGSADVCDENGRNCTTAAAGCGAVVANPNNIVPVEDEEKTSLLETSFPYAVNQDLLQADFKVDSSDCGLTPISAPGPRAASPG